MMLRALVPFIPLLAASSAAAQLSADEIMSRVAANQDRAEAARASYVYDMKVFVRLLRGGGKLAQEETRVYAVAPGPKGAERTLVSTEGRIMDGRKEIRYNQPDFERKNLDIDASLTRSFAEEVMWAKGENTPMVDWFPLTRSHQSHYSFRLLGEEKYKEYNVYRVAFNSREMDWDDEDCWKGEALIESTEFQPVVVNSHWECKVPRAVTVLLGTNLHNLGAKITYQRFAPNVWFPVNCGGEMRVRALFLYGRTIAFSSTNSGFRKTDVSSSVTFEKPAN